MSEPRELPAFVSPTLLDELCDGIVCVEEGGLVRFANAAGRRLLGLLGAVWAGERLERVADVPLDEIVEQSRDGSVRDVAVTTPAARVFALSAAAPLRADQAYTLLVIRDVTELRQEQARRATLERLALLGQMAAAVAHDFNNLLTIIVGQASLMQTRAARCEACQANRIRARSIDAAAIQAAALVRQLLDFGRRERVPASPLDLASLMHGLESLVCTLVGERIRVQFSVAPDLQPVAALAPQIERIVANLVVNAREAMPDGGELTVLLENVRASEEAGDSSMTPVRAVRLVVRDNGCGMDADTQARAFEPFFTTRKDGGTGLGLATVLHTVTELGGQIRVESTVGEGTVFTVELPACRRATSLPAVTVQPRGSLLVRGSRVLVVDDDPGVLDVVHHCLRSAGYEVHVAHDVREAIAVWGGLGHADLLVTDVGLPDGRGPELARALRELRPGLRVLFVTGYDPESVRPPTTDPTTDVLPKPFTPDALIASVGRLLGRGGG